MDPNVLSDSKQVWNMFDMHFDVIVKELTSVPPSLSKADTSINWSYERIKVKINFLCLNRYDIKCRSILTNKCIRYDWTTCSRRMEHACFTLLVSIYVMMSVKVG